MHPGVLEHFLANEEKYGKDVVSQEDIAELRESFMEMWGLDVGEDMIMTDTEAIENLGIRKARESAMSLVLKPQREGGGNNVYKEAIPAFLDRLSPNERQAWVAMRLIQPPQCGNYLVRVGSTEVDSDVHKPVKAATVSELGIFGWALFGGVDGLVDEREMGILVRTKGEENNEGGVATGFSVLDSLLLVD
jgi:glutathione synthase